ncbi:MAG TPA: TonB-dependent receptor plug domain-containing protein, partial [Puia sp.]|nr:TonB-dependent receptor plug domain-containing protein [Puia sp.]
MKKNVYQPWARLFLVWVLLMLFAGTTQAQNSITGRVIDDKDQPVSGATVMIKGTSKGVSTNAEGFFTISAAPGATLVIRSIGFQTQEVALQSEKTLSVRLKGVSTELNEVTVSYGKQRQREVTGSIATISTEKLQDQPVMQFAQQLEGKVAGVSVQESSGLPGRGVDFRIRGAASFSLSNQPLFVIDGLPITGSINNINPDEIETFTVLKDASATALYGSRAANGVILITTRHAKAGDSKIEFNSYYGVQSIPANKVPKPMNAFQYATYMNELYADKATYENYTGGIPAVFQNPSQYGKGTDWYKLLTRKAPIQNYDVTLQSATEHSSSTAIFGYQEQQGVLLNTGSKLFSGRINKDLTTANGKIKMGINIAPSYRLDHNNRNAGGVATEGVNGLFERLFEASPLIKPYNPDGTYVRNVNTPPMVA